MQLKKLSLQESKFVQEIQEYDTGKYVLKLSLFNNTPFSMYAINEGQFLIRYTSHQITDISSPYKFTLITPQIEEYSSGTCIKRTCFLKGYTGNYEIGLSHKNDIFLNNGKKIYYLLQPDILKSYPLNSTKIGVVEKALYWMMLANMHFNVGYGDNIFCLQIDFDGFLDVEEYYEDADIWGYEDPNKWFETPAYMHELLKVKNPESIELNAETIESLMLASIKLKRQYGSNDSFYL